MLYIQFSNIHKSSYTFLRPFQQKGKLTHLIIHHYSSAFEFKIYHTKLLESLSRYTAHKNEKYSGILMKKQQTKKKEEKKIRVKYSEQIFFIATNFFFLFCVWFFINIEFLSSFEYKRFLTLLRNIFFNIISHIKVMFL